MHVEAKLDITEVEDIVADEMQRRFPGYKAEVDFGGSYSRTTVTLTPLPLVTVPATPLVSEQAA